MKSDLLRLIRTDWDIIQLDKFDPDTLLFNISVDEAHKQAGQSDLRLAGLMKEYFDKPRVTVKDQVVHMVLPPQPNFFAAMNK